MRNGAGEEKERGMEKDGNVRRRRRDRRAAHRTLHAERQATRRSNWITFPTERRFSRLVAADDHDDVANRLRIANDDMSATAAVWLLMTMHGVHNPRTFLRFNKVFIYSARYGGTGNNATTMSYNEVMKLDVRIKSCQKS